MFLALGACRSATPPAPAAVRAPIQLPVIDARALDDTTLTAELVEQRIADDYLAGLRRCYDDALAEDPQLRGTLTIAFEYSERQGAYATKVVASDIGLIGCVDGLVDGWRFASPTDAAGQAVEARFEVTLDLTPARVE